MLALADDGGRGGGGGFMSSEDFAHLNEFCAAGARAAQERRRERERREHLLDAGVEDESVLFPADEREVDDVHFIDAAWLTDEFMRTLPDACGNGGRAAVQVAHELDASILGGDDGVDADDLRQAFDEIVGDLDDEGLSRPLVIDGGRHEVGSSVLGGGAEPQSAPGSGAGSSELAASVARAASEARLDALRAQLHEARTLAVDEESMAAARPARDAEPPSWSVLKQTKSVMKLWDIFELRYPFGGPVVRHRSGEWRWARDTCFACV